MTDWYKQDLAYIHDAGFSDYALQSAPGILAILEQHNIDDGLIVDLGCGSGLSAKEFTKAGYQVLGIDISTAMIDLARDRVPDAQFIVESVFKVEIPPCRAVTAIGECFNYLFDEDNTKQNLVALFGRVYDSLKVGGLFIFDIVEFGQVAPARKSQGFREGQDWLILFEKEEDPQKNLLTRRIIALRKLGEYYRRDEEIHRQRLYVAAELAGELRQIGFEVKVMRNYGSFELPLARRAFVARKC
ncbi:MAG: class I SAM-dependent methyltransferase [Okeania sp. SIO2D1]|nr:class I SAM-dependent methyltransferase [Okeania sp. SIO2D1]